MRVLLPLESCPECQHRGGVHLRNGCAVDSDEESGCPCVQPGSGPRLADGSWPAWVNPLARTDEGDVD